MSNLIQKNKPCWLLIAISVGTLFLFAFSPNVSAQPSMEHSVQAGYEYDTNVLKTFGSNRGDSLFRILGKSKGQWAFAEEWQTGWNLQLGGKKYLSHTEQDVLIQYADIPITWSPAPWISILFDNDFKFQDERDKVEDSPTTPPTDINEDYLSPTSRLTARFELPSRWWIEPFGYYSFFRFAPQNTFSFHREKGGIIVRKGLFTYGSAGLQYSYGRQQFLSASREDQDHEISIFAQFGGIPFISLRYTFTKVTSSDPQFKNQAHKGTVIFSIPFGHRAQETSNMVGEDDLGSLFALHLLGTIQRKDFPSVFGSDAEGQRFLLTGSEDENFNSIVFKFSYHPTSRLSFETKYTRYSNELASQSGSFGRSLFYGGLRYAL